MLSPCPHGGAREWQEEQVVVRVHWIMSHWQVERGRLQVDMEVGSCYYFAFAGLITHYNYGTVQRQPDYGSTQRTKELG